MSITTRFCTAACAIGERNRTTRLPSDPVDCPQMRCGWDRIVRRTSTATVETHGTGRPSCVPSRVRRHGKRQRPFESQVQQGVRHPRGHPEHFASEGPNINHTDAEPRWGYSLGRRRRASDQRMSVDHDREVAGLAPAGVRCLCAPGPGRWRGRTALPDAGFRQTAADGCVGPTA